MVVVEGERVDDVLPEVVGEVGELAVVIEGVHEILIINHFITQPKLIPKSIIYIAFPQCQFI